MLMTLHGTNEPMHTCEHTHTHALTEQAACTVKPVKFATC